MGGRTPEPGGAKDFARLWISCCWGTGGCWWRGEVCGSNDNHGGRGPECELREARVADVARYG